jgi:hypothetical protein
MAVPEWLPHLERLLCRSWRTLWSWSGLGWAAVTISVVIFVRTLYSQAAESYKKRYSGFSMGGIMRETRHALYPTVASRSTRLAIYGWAVLFAVAVGMTVYKDHDGLVLAKKKLREDNKTITQEMEAWKSKVRPKNPYVISEEDPALSSITNLVTAFNHLRVPRDTTAPCEVKLTSAQENNFVASVIYNAAVANGCKFEWLKADGLNPDIEKTLGPPGLLVVHMARLPESRNGFVTALTNVFKVKRSYVLPPGSPPDLVWIKIGSGAVWREWP